MAADRRSDALLGALAGYFRILAEPVRLKIVQSLEAGERSVLEIVAATGLRQAHVSRQLGLMAGDGILLRRKEGTRVFYRIGDAGLIDLIDAAEQALREHRRGKLGELD
jgi:DNA-binding transcriptional ArsR family regulator